MLCNSGNLGRFKKIAAICTFISLNHYKSEIGFEMGSHRCHEKSELYPNDESYLENLVDKWFFERMRCEWPWKIVQAANI